MLYLASKSPRRRELLRQLVIDHDVLAVDIAERRQPNEPAVDYVSRVAREKAGAGLLQVLAEPGALVLGADTEVLLDDVVYGKPQDARDAARMLGELSGRTHRVVTVVWLVNAGREAHALSDSQVRFTTLDDAEIKRYVAGNEWEGKAGAYAVQGRAAAYIEHLAGSYSGVMGLPLHETWNLLRMFTASA